MTLHSIKFDNKALQDRFVSELRAKSVDCHLRPDGTVECTEAQWVNVNGIAHTIRDSCFKWYFTWYKSPEQSAQFLALLRNSSLPFELEHHEDNDVFLLSQQHEEEYDELKLRLYYENESNA